MPLVFNSPKSNQEPREDNWSEVHYFTKHSLHADIRTATEFYRHNNHNYKIELDGSILEQVEQFNYLGCELNLYGEPDFDKKIKRFQKIMRQY